MSENYSEKLKDIIRNTELINYIKALKQAHIPDGWVVAGAVRNTVWKILFKDNCTLEVKDIDVSYFSKDLPMEKNQYFVDQLEKIYPTGKWECDNQAWVHLYEPRSDYYMPNAPYNSLEESMNDFWFSVNTIGIRLDDNDEIEILHPEYLDDLFNGVLRILSNQKSNPDPRFQKRVEKITSRCPEIKVIR